MRKGTWSRGYSGRSEDTRGVFEKTEGESREKKVEQQQTVIRKGEEKEGK